MPTKLNQPMRVIIDQLPPSTNHYLGRGRNGRSYRTNEANAWLTYASYKIREAHKSTFDKPVEIHIVVNYSHGGRDLDNFLKLTIDVLRYAKVLESDTLLKVQGVHILTGKRVEKGDESLEIDVRELDL